MRAAIYTRFSSDRQSEVSTEAQDRLCRERAAALGLDVASVHSDSAISGAVPVDARPGGRAMLADALAGRYSVLMIESLDRLSRDIGEQDRIVKRLEHRGIRIIGVSDGYDSTAKGRKVMRVARGLVNELYLDDLRDKVHRTLATKAARGGHVAGLSYGYRSVQSGDDRVLEIVPEQAEVVREIFERYAAGEALQSIVRALNLRGVPGPRGHPWAITALYGSPEKLAGVLNNPLYIGRQIWNRSQWVKDPDTGKRLRTARPESEWQVREEPRLAIVSRVLWDAARARITKGKGRGYRRAGGWPTTLFGGLLRCGRCGGRMTKVDGSHYGCSDAKVRGPTVCAGTRVRVDVADQRLLGAIRDGLCTPATIAEVRAQAAAQLEAMRQGRRSAQERLDALEGEITRLTDAIASYGLSEALAARLRAAEKAREEILGAEIESLPSPEDVVRHYRAAVLRLSDALGKDVRRARAALEAALGPITVEDRGGELWAVAAAHPAAVLMASGEKTGRVAGGRFGARLVVRLR